MEHSIILHNHSMFFLISLPIIFILLLAMSLTPASNAKDSLKQLWNPFMKKMWTLALLGAYLVVIFIENIYVLSQFWFYD